MFKEEIEKAMEAAIVLDESVLLRSSQNALPFYAAHPSNLPLYRIVYKTHLLSGNFRYPLWGGRTYTVESCAVWEVLYLNAKAPPLSPSLEERPLSDADTIVDAIQGTFPALNRRMLLTNAAKYLLNSHYESTSETEGDKQKVEKTGIIRKIDGAFCFDPDFRVTRLIDYGPQKSGAQT